MVVLEAAACGVPTVGTEVGVLAEFAPTAGLVADRRPEAIAAATLELIQHPERRLALGAEARLLVERRFALPVTVPALEEIYRATGASSR
jgi:glycosyltransferase involved in cell wall biosynthesis